MNVLLLDFEATGLNTDTDRILEVGAMVVPSDFRNAPLAMLSEMVWESGYPALTDEVAKITGITEAELLTKGIPPVNALRLVNSMAHPYKIEAVIAFNAKYDKGLYLAELTREGAPDHAVYLSTVPWLCAKQDVESNNQFKSKRLAHLALEYGVAVDPKKLHRAINDVELMREMLFASGAKFEDMLAYAQIPWIVVRAQVSYDDKDKAKAAGYWWEKVYVDTGELTFPKKWVKKIKKTDLEKEGALGFPVEVLQEGV